MVIFNSYVSLPEGKCHEIICTATKRQNPRETFGTLAQTFGGWRDGSKNEVIYITLSIYYGIGDDDFWVLYIQ